MKEAKTQLLKIGIEMQQIASSKIGLLDEKHYFTTYNIYTFLKVPLKREKQQFSRLNCTSHVHLMCAVHSGELLPLFKHF